MKLVIKYTRNTLEMQGKVQKLKCHLHSLHNDFLMGVLCECTRKYKKTPKILISQFSYAKDKLFVQELLSHGYNNDYTDLEC